MQLDRLARDLGSREAAVLQLLVRAERQDHEIGATLLNRQRTAVDAVLSRAVSIGRPVDDSREAIYGDDGTVRMERRDDGNDV